MKKKFCGEYGSFAKSMVKEDVILSLVFVVMEKLMETEFICPCDASNLYHNTLVICSSTIIFCLIVHNKMHQYEKLEDCCSCSNFWRLSVVLISGVLVVFLWFFLLSYDGQYYVCQKTSWNGTWTDNPAKVPRKWCQPSANDTNVNDFQRMSAEWYFQSQAAAIGLLMGLTVCVVFYTIFLLSMRYLDKPDGKAIGANTAELQVQSVTSEPEPAPATPPCVSTALSSPAPPTHSLEC